MAPVVKWGLKDTVGKVPLRKIRTISGIPAGIWLYEIPKPKDRIDAEMKIAVIWNVSHLSFQRMPYGHIEREYEIWTRISDRNGEKP